MTPLGWLGRKTSTQTNNLHLNRNILLDVEDSSVWKKAIQEYKVMVQYTDQMFGMVNKF